MASVRLVIEPSKLGENVKVVERIGLVYLRYGWSEVRVYASLSGLVLHLTELELTNLPKDLTRGVVCVTSMEAFVYDPFAPNAIKPGQKFRSGSRKAWAEVTQEPKAPLNRVMVSISANSIASWRNFRDALLFREKVAVVEQIVPTPAVSA